MRSHEFHLIKKGVTERVLEYLLLTFSGMINDMKICTLPKQLSHMLPLKRQYIKTHKTHVDGCEYFCV